MRQKNQDMSTSRKISKALISVYYKDGLDEVVKNLHAAGVEIYSTGGTCKFIQDLGIPVVTVESLTGFPEILGGRVKTLHPKIFGGILARRHEEMDQKQCAEFGIPFFDLIMVDLYPFAETLANSNDEQTIIEKIDIGGVSLIRAAAKNFHDTLIVCDRGDFDALNWIIRTQDASTTKAQRKEYAAKAFQTTSDYDALIHRYMSSSLNEFSLRISPENALRYGENPHQKASFYGNLQELFDQLNGKELSYNNLLDIDAATGLIGEFKEPTMAIIKHNNPCGLASRANVFQAWTDALAGDPVSAFGGVIACNSMIDKATAAEIDNIFFEVLIAPAYENEALELLCAKKNRIVLVQKSNNRPQQHIRSSLNGILVQDRDDVISTPDDLQQVTVAAGSAEDIQDLIFAEKIAKHTKSNTIVLARNRQLIGIGCGQTSRVDALQHALAKAKTFGFDLHKAVMASDAFFPFPDCVEIAGTAGIHCVIQPGGSIRDNASVAYCDANQMAMYYSGKRHFRH